MPQRPRAAESGGPQRVEDGAGFPQRSRDASVERESKLVPSASVPGDLFENALHATIQVSCGDVQYAHQRIRRPTEMTSPGFTMNVAKSLLLTLIRSTGFPWSFLRVTVTAPRAARSLKSPAITSSCSSVVSV